MKIAMVLHGLLLARLSSSQHCQKEGRDNFYCIYHTHVEVKAYYCFYNVTYDFRCKISDSVLNIEDQPFDILSKCVSRSSQTTNGKMIAQTTLCSFLGHAKLLDNTITLHGNKTCVYDKGNCYDENISSEVYWIKRDACKGLNLIQNGRYRLWTVDDDSKFIRNTNNNLQLKKKMKLCGAEIWMTDYEGIIVSKHRFVAFRRHQYTTFNSSVPQICEEPERNVTGITLNRNFIDTPNSWYVYRYSTNVTVYYCTLKPYSCQLNEGVSTYDSDFLNECTKIISFPEIIVMCKKSLRIDFDNDTLSDIGPYCKSGRGECFHERVFWQYRDRCNATLQIYEGLERTCANRTCVIQKNGSTELVLEKQGKLCGESVWYTNESGVVASKKKLQFVSMDDKSAFPIQDNDKDLTVNEVNEMSLWGEDQWKLPASSGSSEYYVMVPLIICLLWITFKFAVCLAYTFTKCKKKKVSAQSEDVELRNFGERINAFHLR